MTTNIRFLRDVLAHEAFRRGKTTTRFIDDYFADWSPRADVIPDEALIAAALSEAQAQAAPAATVAEGDLYSPWLARDGFRVGVASR